MLGTYCLQDPNGHQLQSLIHGNRIIKANIRTTDELRSLWVSPKFSAQLRRLTRQLNRDFNLHPAGEDNNRLLEQLIESEDAASDDNDLRPLIMQPFTEPESIQLQEPIAITSTPTSDEVPSEMEGVETQNPSASLQEPVDPPRDMSARTRVPSRRRLEEQETQRLEEERRSSKRRKKGV